MLATLFNDLAFTTVWRCAFRFHLVHFREMTECSEDRIRRALTACRIRRPARPSAKQPPQVRSRCVPAPAELREAAPEAPGEAGRALGRSRM